MAVDGGLCLRVDAWPQEDRRRWEAAGAPGRRLSGSRARLWAAATRRKHVSGYGRWLAFLARTNPKLLDEKPADRVRDDILHDYVDALDHLAEWSVRTYLVSLLVMLQVLEPNVDWSWLNRRIRHTARRGGDRRYREPTVTARELYHFGLMHMEEAERIDDVRHRAIAYRDGFVFALLAARPFRIRTFALIRIGIHLVDVGGRLLLRFGSGDTKTRRPLDVPYPDELRPHLERYLGQHRPVLSRGRPVDALWVSDRATPCPVRTLSDRIMRITTAHFPPGFGPHGFRYAAATLVAIERPEEMGIIRAILGHATLETGQRHYNRASGAQAASAHQEALAARRRRRYHRQPHPWPGA